MPSALTSRLEALQTSGGFSSPLIAAFGAFLENAPEEELFRTSPLRYAEKSGISEREAVDLFLHATRIGILEFNWGVLCPGCMGFMTTAGGLRELSRTRHCSLCRVDVPVSIDDSVEVAFTVAPATRRIRFHDSEKLDLNRDVFKLFFSSSMQLNDEFSRHVLASVKATDRVPADGTLDLSVLLEPRSYVLLAPELHSVLHFDAVADGPSELEVDLHDGRAIPATAQVKAGKVRLRVRNRTLRKTPLVVFADPVPPPEARGQNFRPPMRTLLPYLSGRKLITNQTFTDLFRSESIPAEGGLDLKDLTVLFTDLKGSTAMYERIGDLRAYDLVRRHFGVLRDIVSKRGGAVVKTIGDAIMASFSDSAAAMDAAVVMNREVRGVGPDLLLKIGIHSGPCIAVELNERLDYFGQTVNLAARVQNLAHADEIVVTEPVFAAPGVAELVGRAGLKLAREKAHLKGIGAATAVVRLK